MSFGYGLSGNTRELGGAQRHNTKTCPSEDGGRSQKTESINIDPIKLSFSSKLSLTGIRICPHNLWEKIYGKLVNYWDWFC